METKSVYVNLNGKYIKKTRTEAHKKALDYNDEEVVTKDDSLVWETNGQVEDMFIEDDDALHIAVDTPVGFVSIAAPISEELLIDMIGLTVKRLNKFKTAIEALK